MAQLQWQNKGHPLRWFAQGRDGTEFLIYGSGGKRDLIHRHFNPKANKQTIHRQEASLPHDDAAKALAQQWEDEGYTTGNSFFTFSYPPGIDPVREAKKAIRQAEREVCPECGGSKDIGCICPHGAKAGDPGARDIVYEEITRGHQQRLRDDQAWKDHLL